MYEVLIELRDATINRVFEYTSVEATEDDPIEIRMVHIEGRQKTGVPFIKLLEIGDKHFNLSALNKRFNLSTVVSNLEKFLI